MKKTKSGVLRSVLSGNYHSADLSFIGCDFQLKELIDVRPEQSSQYIRSTTEPFDDEMELSENRGR